MACVVSSFKAIRNCFANIVVVFLYLLLRLKVGFNFIIDNPNFNMFLFWFENNFNFVCFLFNFICIPIGIRLICKKEYPSLKIINDCVLPVRRPKPRIINFNFLPLLVNLINRKKLK